jgi:hypothetical protein
MSAEPLRIVVSGLVAQYPLGGVAWDYAQYAAGLARLGHDVYYVEDTGQNPYNPDAGGLSADPSSNVRYLGDVMARFGLEDRWMYRFREGGPWFGLPDRRRGEVLGSADLLINVSGTLARPERYRQIPVLAYVDSDPVFTQVKIAKGDAHLRRLVDAHDVHFSFGERLPGAAPDSGHRWRPTRQPVLLDEWRTAGPPSDTFTTVMNWTSINPLEWNGSSFGQKDVELERVIDLPAHVPESRLELAIADGKTRRTPRELLAHRGWHVVDPTVVCATPDAYRAYVAGSKAELSVAKHGYVAGNAGWFSCRSACYLAAGRPVVVQHTGSVIPAGEGLLTFADRDEAVEAIRSVERDYARHAAAARALAHEWFGSDRVLAALVDEAMSAGAGTVLAGEAVA